MRTLLAFLPFLAACGAPAPKAAAPVAPPPVPLCATTADHVLTADIRPADFQVLNAYAGPGDGRDTGDAYFGAQISLTAPVTMQPVTVSPGDTVAVVARFPVPVQGRYDLPPDPAFHLTLSGWTLGPGTAATSEAHDALLYDGSFAPTPAAGLRLQRRVATGEVIGFTFEAESNVLAGTELGCLGVQFTVPATLDGDPVQPGGLRLRRVDIEASQRTTPAFHVGMGGRPQIAPVVSFRPPCPGAGTLAVTGGTAHGQLHVFLGASTGSAAIPSGACAGTATGLSTATRVRDLQTTGVGEATTLVTLPAGACGRAIQVLDVTTCSLSRVVTL